MERSVVINKWISNSQRNVKKLSVKAIRTLRVTVEKAKTFKTRIPSPITKFASFWLSLTLGQRCYLTSTLLLICFAYNDLLSFGYLAIPVTIVIIGLCHEFWPNFLKVWDSLQGKTVILIFYGIMANTALASAAGLVNDVTHVSADQLSYSHNMALIINIPTWFILSSVLMLVLIQVLLPVYLLLLIALKPFGAHSLFHKSDYRFVFTTAFVRYFWASFLLVYFLNGSIQSGFINSTTPILGSIYDSFVHFDNDKLANAESKITSDGRSFVSFEINELEAVLTNEQVSNLTSEQKKAFDEKVSRQLDSVAKMRQKSNDVIQIQKSILAQFIFHYEADSYSRCEHPEGTRVVELNDYEILTVKPNKALPIGFEFDVIACRSPGIQPVLPKS